MKTRGVVRARKMTKHVIVMYACDGGSTRLEMTPGGAFSAGVKFGSAAGVDMTTPECTHNVRRMQLKDGRQSRFLYSSHGGGNDPTVVGYHPAFEGDGCSLAPPSKRAPPTGYDNNNHHLTRLVGKRGNGQR